MTRPAITPENIVLIGFMGSGKSTVGRSLRQILGYSLTDMDLLIEQKMGKKISEIFAEEGETAFRDFETLQLTEIAKRTEEGQILSTGGGIVIRPENRRILRKIGYVVWLDAAEEIIHERTSHNQDRPLLNIPNARDKIQKLLAQRAPWYEECAHLRIDIKDLDSSEIASGILESARYFFAQEK